MSKTDGEKPKKKRGLVGKIGLAVLLLGAGGGGAFGLMASGMIGPGHGAGGNNEPHLIRKGESDPYPFIAEGAKEEIEVVHGDGGSEYRTAYYVFDDEFTSNLKNSPALIQVTLAASTRRDGRVLMWLDKHELAIRSQLLVDLADTPEEDVFAPEGKVRLQKRLTASINRILTETEGFGGVDQVYFRSFLIQ